MLINDTIADGYIRTFTGKHINPLDPDPELIDPLDIAHSLALVNRFTGHTRAPMSVAQHSCLVHDYVGESYRLEALLHDASEAYLSDLARPVKSQEEMNFYRVAEFKLMEAISEKFDFIFPLPETVKEADNVLLHTEIRDFFGVSPNGHRTLKEIIDPWEWKTSKLQFIIRLRQLDIDVGSVLV